jgi:hypothetical protein
MSPKSSLRDRWKVKLSSLQLSVGHLLEKFGQTDLPMAGLVINLGLAAVGLLVYWQTTGLIAYAGGTWAILHVLAVVKWVIGL